VIRAIPREPSHPGRCGADGPSTRISLRILTVLLGVSLTACQTSPLEMTAPLGADILQPHLLVGQMPSFLNGRRFWVYLPPSYYTAGSRYPVLYLLDGEAMFNSSDESWHVDLMVDSLIHVGAITPIIVVAIVSAGAGRVAEYSPWPQSFYPGTGGGESFLVETVTTLKPRIDGLLRTESAAATTCIGGASIAGLLSVYAGYAHSSAFGNVIAMSGTYHWGDDSLFRFVSARQRGHLSRVYQDTGVFDNPPRDVMRLDSLLITQGFTEGIDLLSVIDSTGHHSYQSWRRRLPAALTFIYGPLRNRLSAYEAFTSTQPSTPARWVSSVGANRDELGPTIDRATR